jgi:DNA-binding CsgD family transcriptional regulator
LLDRNRRPNGYKTVIGWHANRTTEKYQTIGESKPPNQFSQNQLNLKLHKSKIGTKKMLSKLTNGELKVAHLIVQGLSNLEIASKLKISEKTVKFHSTVIYRKTGSARRSQFIAKYLDTQKSQFENRIKLDTLVSGRDVNSILNALSFNTTTPLEAEFAERVKKSLELI